MVLCWLCLPGLQAALFKQAAPVKPEVKPAPKTNAPPVAPVPVVPKSVFDDKLKGGKDPFFPNSSRRAEKVVTTPGGTNTTKAPPNQAAQLQLKYISPDRRFILVNDKNLGVNEEASVRIANGRVKVKCLSISDKSAVVTIEGDPERKELRLREGL